MVGTSSVQSKTKIPHPRHPFNDDLEAMFLSRELLRKPTVQEATRVNGGICYLMDNGDKMERIGGSIAWRNNNPGCIRYSQKVADMGAIGRAYGFAIFPNEETGMRAIKTLLLSDSYCNLNIAQAISKYAPPHENNTLNYINSLCNIVGVSKNTKLCELNEEQMTYVTSAIRTLEGWIEGVELHTKTPKPEYTTKTVHAPNDHTLYILNRRACERVL